MVYLILRNVHILYRLPYIILFTLADTHMSNTYASLSVNENTMYTWRLMTMTERHTSISWVVTLPLVRLRLDKLIFFYAITLVLEFCFFFSFFLACEKYNSNKKECQRTIKEMSIREYFLLFLNKIIDGNKFVNALWVTLTRSYNLQKLV